MLSGVLTLGLASGCAVSVDSPDVTPSVEHACRTFLHSLPSRVDDRRRVPIDPADALGAAWGNPAIVLRCGVGTPEGFTRASPCQTTNGVDWFVPPSQIDDQSSDVLMTTVDRTPRVEVHVPASYRPPDAVMVDLTRDIRAHTRKVGRGCL